jgi:hypothetical protein
MKTSEVNAALRARFCAPEWALFFEVGDATGAQHRRWADAVAMNLYPSRGLEIQGFEVKVSRSDWTKELKNPDKSAPVQQYCDRWWIVTPEGIIKDGELPPTWGHYIVSPNGKLRQAVAAPMLEPIAVSRAFVASMMRRASSADEDVVNIMVAEKLNAAREVDERRIQQEIDRRTSSYEELKNRVREFEETSGIKIGDRWMGGKEVAKAVKLVMASGVNQTYGGIKAIRNTITSTLNTIDKAMAEFNIAPEEDTED